MNLPLRDSVASMQQSANFIAALPFKRTQSFARAALMPDAQFESLLIRDAEPYELALFRPTDLAATRYDATLDQDPAGDDRWTATKHPAPRRAIGKDKASPLKERRGAPGVDPARALRAAQKLLEVYPLPRAQEHVDGLFDQYDGLVRTLNELEETLKRPLARQTVPTADSIRAAEREDAIRREEMETFALEQIEKDREAEIASVQARIQKRKAPNATQARPNPLSTANLGRQNATSTSQPPATKPPRLNLDFRRPPSPKAPPTPVSRPLPRQRPASPSPPPAAPSQTTPTRPSPARTTPNTTPRATVKTPVASPKRSGTGVSIDDLDVIAGKIWNGVGEALRPWARKTLVRDGAPVPSPLTSLPFEATFNALATVLAAPLATGDGPNSPTPSYATLTSEQEDADPFPPSPAQLIEYQLLNLLLSTLSGRPPIPSSIPRSPSSAPALPPLGITLRDAVLPSSLPSPTGPNGAGGSYARKEKEPMVSMNGVKAWLGAYAKERGWGEDMGTTAVYALVSKAVVRIDRRGKEGPMLGFKA